MQTYADKLKDPRWQKKRLEIFLRDNWTCKTCGDTKTELTVHHKEYKQDLEPWEYEDSFLETKCVNCHEQHHDISGGFHIANALDEKNDEMESLARTKNTMIGVPTGFKDFDTIFGGLHESELIVLASCPRMGRTELAVNLAKNASLNDHPVVYFSLSTSRELLVEYFLSAHAKIKRVNFRNGKFSNDDWARMTDIIKELTESPLCIDDTPYLTLGMIERRIRNMKKTNGLKLAIIDNLELLVPKIFELPHVVIRLKKMAHELKIPIVVLCSIDRSFAQRADKRPFFDDIKHEYILELADTILFLYQDEIFNCSEDNPNRGTAELIVAHSRVGVTEKVVLTYNDSYGAFSDHSDET